MRAFLSAYLNNGRIDINGLNSSVYNILLQQMEDILFIDPTELSQDEFFHYQQYIYQYFSENHQQNSPLFIKIHDAYRLSPINELPVFQSDVTLKVIYIVRNPLDVAVSFSKYLNLDLDTTIERYINNKNGFVCARV